MSLQMIVAICQIIFVSLSMAADTSSTQYMQVMFGPTTDIDTITESLDLIFDVFEWITKIPASKWSNPWDSWSYYDSNIDIEYIYTDFAVEVNSETEIKITSFRSWLYEDEEQFITLFNTANDTIMNDLYIVGITDGYFSGYMNDQGTTLDFLKPFSYYPESYYWDIVLNGYGIPYSIDYDTTNIWSTVFSTSKLFCNNTWGWTETQVVCKSMGYDYGIYLDGVASYIKDYVYTPSYDVYYGNVNCTGNEETIWDCDMIEHASSVTGDCSNFTSAVAVYCVRFYQWQPLRAFKTHDSYDDFLLLYYGNFTVCADELLYDSETMATLWCDMFNMDGFNITKVNPEEYYVSDDRKAGRTTNYTADPQSHFEFEHAENCSLLRVAVQCEFNGGDIILRDGSNDNGAPCAADIDCKQSSSNHQICHPDFGQCVDIRVIEKPDGYSPCYSQSECASGTCMDPGLSGICTLSKSVSDFCFDDYHPCFDDDQCCDDWYCIYGYCSEDQYDGEQPQFNSISPRRMSNGPNQEFEVHGDYLRSHMMFKLSTTNCSDDRSPVSNAPVEWHYADRGDMYTEDSVLFNIYGMYTSTRLGETTLCYAVNDYANYFDTGLTIGVPRNIHTTLDSDALFTATVNWITGSNVFYENSTDNYIEYELVLSRTFGSGEYMEMDLLDNDWDNTMYPQSSWFYHQEKYISESMIFEYDEDNGVPNRGYRDHTNSDIPINVRLYWNNDGYPEIMDRVFYVVHTVHGYINEWGWGDGFKIADIEFTMIDDDPHIISDSLRFDGDSAADGTNNLEGEESGDETLVFTCNGCGTEDNGCVGYIGYGPYSNRDFYSGNDIYVTNTIDIDTNEVTASYVSFQTSYLPYEDAPSSNLMFKIAISSRFNYSLYKLIEPGFNFSYPGDIDATKPVISKIVGDGCMNIGKRALNCPTDGKYNGTAARITLYGTNFPETRDNVTVEVTIDGIECGNVEFWTVENSDGLRNASCEYGAGVSAHSTDGYSYVQLSYFSNTKSTFSSSVRYFNYSHPTITAVVGCNQNTSNLHTANCTRIGGGINKLRIVGTNFGKSGARVFIGGHTAIETLHDAEDLHTLLWVQYGPGTRLQEKIMVMNSRGGTTMTQAYLSYNQCPVGYRQHTDPDLLPNNQGYQCQICGAGTYSNTENADTCFECEAGKYQSDNGSSICIPCAVGTYAQGMGNSECSLCPPGYKSETTGGIECLECSEGQFNTEPGSSSCASCNENSFSIKSERNRCLCDQGYYMYDMQFIDEQASNLTRVLCRECQEGMVCDQSGLNWTQIVPVAGYMPLLHTTPNTMEMMKCINTACVGGEEKCADGFTGVLCTDCEKGLGKISGHGCETCLAPAINGLRLLGVLGVVCVMVVLFIRKTITTAQAEKSDMSTIGKIGFSFLQFNSMALLFDYEFPPLVEGFLKVQEQPATIANGVLSVDCFVKDSDTDIKSLYVKSVCYLVLPVVICLVCRVVFCRYQQKKATQHRVDIEVKRRRKQLATLTRMELPEDSKAKAYVDAWNYYITAVIITIFLVHPSIVQMTFAMLNCKKLGVNPDDYYLIEDMTIQCGDVTHFIFVLLVAAPMLIFYVFGMPLFVLYRLYLNRDELTKDFDKINPNVVNRYHFLFKGYEPEFYYWEIIIMIRKILMVVVAVFFSYDIQIQALLATLLVVVALCVHSLACPYVTDAMDGLELLSLFGSFCTYFFGQFLFTESVSNIGKGIVSFIIVAVNLTVVTAVGLMVAGKGLTAVSAVSKKFRRIIFCQKRSDKVDQDTDNDDKENEQNEGRLKRSKSRQTSQMFDPYQYDGAKLDQMYYNKVPLQSDNDQILSPHEDVPMIPQRNSNTNQVNMLSEQ